jgi:aminotransferase
VINLFQPLVGPAELAAVDRVFSTSWLGTGGRIEEFERAFAGYIRRAPSEVATVTCCTEGLFQAVQALELGPGDEVILPSVSFIGAAHAVRSSGARVTVCDVDPVTINPTVDHVESVSTPATKAILVLHYGGLPGSIGELAEWARERSILLIEDAAIGLGSFEDGRACGTFGDIGVWSFDSMKLLTTGDGGMVWCRHESVADRVRMAVKLGVRATGFERRTQSTSWWEVEAEMVARRATMNDIAGAMGLVQLQRIDEFLDRRKYIAATYDAALEDLPWVTLPPDAPDDIARTFYWIQVSPGLRDELALHLLEREVYSSFRYWPLHRIALYRSDGPFPGADRAADSTLLIPMHQGLDDSAVARVVDAIRSFDPPRQYTT